MVNDRLPRRADVRAIGRPHQSGLLRRRRWLDLKTRRTVHWRRGTKGDAGAVCIAHATRSSKTAKKTDRPAASARAYPRYAPPSPRSSTPVVADDVPFGPGTRQSSTQEIYQSSAKLVGLFRSKASETMHPPANGKWLR